MSHLNTEATSLIPVNVASEVRLSVLDSRFRQRPVMASLCVTLVTLCFIEILAMLGLTIPNPPMVYVLAVVYCSYAGGTAAGLLAAVICVSYSAYFMFIAGHITPQPDRAVRLLVLSISTPLIAILVGHQTRRFNQAMQQMHTNMVTTNRRQRRRKDEQLKVQKERLDYLKLHDTVTGLPNQSQFIELAATALAEQSTCSVLVIGLDRSRSAHQVLAHAFQQTVLRLAGERIRGCVSDTDIVASLRGDDFVVLLNGTINKTQVQGIAARIKAILQEPYRIQDQDVYIDVHLGAAFYPVDAATAAILVDRARLAMHNEAATPTSACQFYTRKMGEEAAFTQSLATDLHHAVACGEL